MPFLIKAALREGHPADYPFNLAIISGGLDMEFKNNVTFLVGENGTGKSTIIEAIADQCGFNLSGGNKNHN